MGLATSCAFGRALVFDVRIAEESFPRRCQPLMEISLPDAKPSARIESLAFTCEGSNLLIGIDDKLASFAIAEGVSQVHESLDAAEKEAAEIVAKLTPRDDVKRDSDASRKNEGPAVTRCPPRIMQS